MKPPVLACSVSLCDKEKDPGFSTQVQIRSFRTQNSLSILTLLFPRTQVLGTTSHWRPDVNIFTYYLALL